MHRIFLCFVLASILVAGCAAETPAPTEAPSDQTLSRAVQLMDSMDTFTTEVNVGDINQAAAELERVDARIEGFGKSDGADTMPEFLEAVTAWRAALADALETDSATMQERALDTANEQYAVAERALNDALDAAGK